MNPETEVSEANMREFFQKVVDHVATLSTQASQVEGLRQQVNALSERVSVLEQANADLRNQLSDAHNTISRMEQETISTRNQLEAERNAVTALRETIVQRDAGVVQLESDLRAERDTAAMVTRERDDARNTANDLQALVEELRRKLADVTQDRDHLVSQNLEANRTIAELQAKLDRVQSILNPVQPHLVAAS